jgi:alkanesulfonate monooxygenase SsuD/methylene tetrahydromethanopterin reductase-like flavin-dependent oxidoreductase (luciferase family)
MSDSRPGDLEFGVFDVTAIPDDDPAETAAAYEAHLAEAQLAEASGYDQFHFIEHQNSDFECISAPTVYLAALARATKTIRIGAMIFQLPFHHPVRLAQDTAMIDHLSHGRLEFGVGFGTRAREFEPWKIEFKDRRARGQDVLEVVIKAWTHRKFDHDGPYYSFAGASPQPHPYQLPHPPIWLGAHSLSSFEYAAKHNFNVAQIFEVERLTITKFEHWIEAWRSHGHPDPMPKRLLVRHVHVAETDEAARGQAERYMLEGIQGPAGVERALKLRPEESTPETLELARVYYETGQSVEFWLEEGLAFLGSPETVAAAIAAQQQRVGYDVLLLNHQFVNMPSELYLSSIKLFGEQVIPAVRALQKAAVSAGR